MSSRKRNQILRASAGLENREPGTFLSAFVWNFEQSVTFSWNKMFFRAPLNYNWSFWANCCLNFYCTSISPKSLTTVTRAQQSRRCNGFPFQNLSLAQTSSDLQQFYLQNRTAKSNFTNITSPSRTFSFLSLTATKISPLSNYVTLGFWFIFSCAGSS